MEENGGGCPKLGVLQEIIRLYGDFTGTLINKNLQRLYWDFDHKTCEYFTGDFDHKTL